jgi:hypothetical protein
MNYGIRTSLLSLVLTLVLCTVVPAAPVGTPLTTESEFEDATAEADQVTIQSTHTIGGRFDLIGDGALLLAKKKSGKPFYNTTRFANAGRWTSNWLRLNKGQSIHTIEATVWDYGRKQKMGAGWTKFSGNPLLSAEGWDHATDQSLSIPGPSDGWPNDQSLVRGAGKWEGKWLILFGRGSWSKYGWAAAVADSLAPLKQGQNPFSLTKPFPLITGDGRGGKYAPNDWIYVEPDDRWYAPDEYGGGDSHMWTSPDLIEWTNNGPINNMTGHDPGMAWDGEEYHLFNENSPTIAHMVSDDPLETWEYTGAALDVGGHTGDADVSFFNNRWHMFFDDDPHNDYRLGYAWTTPEKFPKGWQLTHHIYGPHNPEQNQQWDNPENGNNFGTGDADVAVEGDTLYLTHERPTGAAFKTLKVRESGDAPVRIRLHLDRDGDGQAETTTDWHTLPKGKKPFKPGKKIRNASWKQVRIELKLKTEIPSLSPMVRELSVQTE